MIMHTQNFWGPNPWFHGYINLLGYRGFTELLKLVFKASDKKTSGTESLSFRILEVREV